MVARGGVHSLHLTLPGGAAEVVISAWGHSLSDMSASGTGQIVPEIAERWPDLADLELLVQVEKTGGVGAAARALGVAQPNASRTLARLERRLGLSLLARSPRGTRLTPQGQLVAQWATILLGEADRWRAGVEALRAPAEARLDVTASLTVAEYLAPVWLAGLRARCPEVSVHMAVQNSKNTLERVRSGAADVGFIEGPHDLGDLNAFTVGTDRLVLVVAPGHAWATRRGPVPAAELGATALVVREDGSGTRATLAEALTGLATCPPALILSSNAAVLGAVAAGAGPAVLSGLAARSEISRGALIEVPTELDLSRRLRAVWKGSRRLVGPVGELVRLAVEPR